MLLFDGIEFGPFGFTCLAVAAFLVTGAGAVLLTGRAGRIGLVSRHRRDRFGAARIPLTGGPGLMLGVLVVLLALRMPIGMGALVAILGFFAIGLADDLRDLKPLPKGSLQIVVGVGAMLLIAPSPAHLGLGLFVFLVCVNASNYLDNMDALLPGVGLTLAVSMLLLSPFGSTGAPLLLGALPAILFLTLPPARLYLGDSGSHLVGTLLALDAIALLVGPDGVRPHYLLPLAVLFAVPLLDVATVTISRLRRKRPVLRGGTDHLSHRLVRLGFPVPRAVLILVLASGLCGVISLLLVHSS